MKPKGQLSVVDHNDSGGDHGLRNIILLGLAFLLQFTAFITTGNIVQIILKSMQSEDPEFSGDGYISMAIVYSVFAFSTIMAPCLVEVLKAKWTLILCSCFYVLYIANLIFTTTWSLYLVSVLLGIAAAGLWTAHGNYLTLISNKDTISRNSGIFFVFMFSSQFVGNGFVFWQFFGKTHIDPQTRTIVLSFLTAIGISAVICLRFLQNIKSQQSPLSIQHSTTIHAAGTRALLTFKTSVKILKERHMQLLILPFLYLGINISFFTSVYPTSVGFTTQFGVISKSLAGLSGIFIGLGGLIGGAVGMILGPRVDKRYCKRPFVLAASLLLILSYILVYFNIPNEAPLGPTDNLSYFNPPSPVIAMVCSFLLGLGDTLFHIQIFGTLSTVWITESASAYAILHFFESLAVASQFILSTKLGLLEQLITLSVLCVLSSVAFWFSEKSVTPTVLAVSAVGCRDIVM